MTIDLRKLLTNISNPSLTAEACNKVKQRVHTKIEDVGKRLGFSVPPVNLGADKNWRVAHP